MSVGGVQWTAVVVTCQDRDAALAIQHELEKKQKLGLISSDSIVLAVNDPQARVGSGGATLNALLVVAEHISAKRGFNVVNPDVLYNSRILILHLGRQYGYELCGRAFLPLPVRLPATHCAVLTTNLDVIYHHITHTVAVGSPFGVWVCSTDMLLHVPQTIEVPVYKDTDVCVISVSGSVDYATRHGVYKLSDTGEVGDILYQAPASDIQKCVRPDSGHVPLVAGIVYISSRVSETLLGLHTSPPLDACTYMGIDSGAQPIQLSLFFDLLLAMCGDVTAEDFISGSRSSTYGQSATPSDSHGRLDTATKVARQQVWTALREYTIKMCYIPEGRHLYLEEGDGKILDLVTEYTSLSSLPADSQIHTYLQQGSSLPGVTVQNSYLPRNCAIGEGSSVLHCYLTPGVSVGQRCLVTGVNTKHITDSRIHVPDETVMVGVHIHLPFSSTPQYVLAVWGLHDNINKKGESSCLFSGQSLEVLYSRTGILATDLWETHIPAEDRSVETARLYPVFETEEAASLTDLLWLSDDTAATDTEALDRWRCRHRVSLQEVLHNVDYMAEFASRRALFHTISLQIVTSALLGSLNQGLNSFYTTAVCDNMADLYLAKLDHIAGTCRDPGVAARTLANIANMLGAMAHNAGGLRSGPAGNRQWAHAFSLLEKEDICGGVAALTTERKYWLSRPQLLVRAARHYEGAAQILIRHAVMSARQFIHTSACEPPAIDEWVKASCPARIDIAGGWSDTPPITYEHGGAVINAAVAIDGQRPIGAKVRRLKECEIMLSIVNCGQTVWEMTITDLQQLADYTNPQAPGALLKAAFCCAEIVELPSNKTLQQQLRDKHGGGFQLQSWSNLKHGSGLGTSSILAGVMMAALWRASGRSYDTAALNHAVSHLEQMITTGGGWQDTVGGLTGGVKVGHSKGELPLRIETSYPRVSDATVQAFSDRLVLVYTGKTRLARNLLQNVLRNWFARDPEIVSIIDDLVKVAWECAAAFEQDDLAMVGACMNRYWSLKKQIAPGSEPSAVTHMMAALRPHAHGLCLAGAGGGGYMYVLMKEPGAVARVKQILASVNEASNIEVHDGTIDMDGLKVTVEGRR